MSLKIVTGGTTDAADGTLVSSGNKIPFLGVDTVVDLHLRCDDDTYSADQTISLPSDGDIEISFDGGSTWKDYADSPANVVTGIGIGGLDVGDLNFPIKLRQHASTATTSGTFTSDGTFTACTALGDVAGFTVTPGDAQNALSWTALTNRTAYRIDRALDSGFTTGVALDISPGQTSTSFTDTGRTNGTTYYYRIKGVGTYRYKDSASYATGNGAPVSSVAGFAVTSISGTTVNLGWTAYSGAHHYQIEWGTDGVTFGSTIDSLSGTSYAFSGSANTKYYFRIKAHDISHGVLTGAYGNIPYAGVQILITAPAHDQSLRAANATWATARAGTGTNTTDGSSDATEGSAWAALDTGVYIIDRHLMDFDTSTLVPSGVTIEQAWMRMTTTFQHAGANGGLAIVKHAATSSPAATADFATCVLTDLGGPTSALTINTPTDYAITSPNTNVIAGGTTKLALIERSKDMGNVAPTGTSTFGNNIGAKTNATTDRRPQLKVSYRG